MSLTLEERQKSRAKKGAADPAADCCWARWSFRRGHLHDRCDGDMLKAAVHKRNRFLTARWEERRLWYACGGTGDCTGGRALSLTRVACTMKGFIALFYPSMSVLPRTVMRQVLCASDTTQLSRLKNVTPWDPGSGPPRYVSRVSSQCLQQGVFNLPAP